MSSKEMLDHLSEMKIPAKSASSTLEDAYVAIVRKKLKPILEARAAEIEAEKKAAAEKAAADDAAQLTYVQCGILAAILLNSGAADYVVTGCGRLPAAFCIWYQKVVLQGVPGMTIRYQFLSLQYIKKA